LGQTKGNSATENIHKHYINTTFSFAQIPHKH